MEEIANKDGNLINSKRPSILEALNSSYQSLFPSSRKEMNYFKEFFHEGLKYSIIPNIYGEKFFDLLSKKDYDLQPRFSNFFKNAKSDIVIVNIGKQYPKSVEFKSAEKNFKRFGFSFLIDIPEERNEKNEEEFVSLYHRYLHMNYSTVVHHDLRVHINKLFDDFLKKNSNTIWLPAFFYYNGTISETFTQLDNGYFNSSNTPFIHSFHTRRRGKDTGLTYTITISNFFFGNFEGERKEKFLEIFSDNSKLKEFRYEFRDYEFPYTVPFTISLKSKAFKTKKNARYKFFVSFDMNDVSTDEGLSHEYQHIDDVYYIFSYKTGVKLITIENKDDLILLEQILPENEYKEFIVPHLEKIEHFFLTGEITEEDIRILKTDKTDKTEEEKSKGEKIFKILLFRTYIKTISILHKKFTGDIFDLVSDVLNLNSFNYEKGQEDALFYRNLTTKESLIGIDPPLLTYQLNTRNSKQHQLASYGNQFIPQYLVRNILLLKKKIDVRMYNYKNIDNLTFGIESHRKMLTEKLVNSSYIIDLTYNYEYISKIISLIISAQINVHAIPKDFIISYVTIVQTRLIGKFSQKELKLYRNTLIDLFEKIKKKDEPVLSGRVDNIHKYLISLIYSILSEQIPFSQDLTSHRSIVDYSVMIKKKFSIRYDTKQFTQVIVSFCRSIFLDAQFLFD